jgi:transposase
VREDEPGRGYCKPKQEIHVILDNLSAHKTAKVQVFLEEHPRVHLHFIPTYSCWLHQVEIWFARIEREVIGTRSVHLCSATSLGKLMRYIWACSKTVRPFPWKYSDTRQRVRVC